MSSFLNRLLKILLALLTILVVALAAEVVERRLADKTAEAGGTGVLTGTPVPPTTIQLTAPEAAFSALSYSNGTITLSFSQDKDGTWYWDGDRDFPLDTACIDTILSKLALPDPSSAVAEGESPETFGLDEQSVYLTARNADGTRLHLDFGKTVANSTARYVMMNDDPDSVYIMEADILAHMDTPIYDMMLLPKLPQIKESDLSSVIIRGRRETAVVAEAPTDPSAPVSWLINSTPGGDNGLLRELIAELSALSLARCENFKPSEAALTAFGLDEPGARVTVFYGADQSLTLTVGSRTLAGGAYYVMLQDDTTIYSMDAAALDTVLTVAVYGLTEDQAEIPAEPLPMDDEPSGL